MGSIDIPSAIALAVAYLFGAGTVVLAGPLSLFPHRMEKHVAAEAAAPSSPTAAESAEALAKAEEPAPAPAAAAWPPAFEDYPVPREAMYHGTPATPDWKSDADAWRFRTRFRNALKQGPNFAGDIAVVPWGCGTSCQIARFANVRTGFVYAPWVETTSGVEFRPNSYLFITNPPGTQCAGECDHATCRPPQYWVWDKGALFEVKPPGK